MSVNKTSVAQAVVEALWAEKVEFVFGLAGYHVLPILDALVDTPEIRHVVVKHESNAAFMAGMYGYLTGKPGVVLVTAGPGATNSISGVVQAYASSLPMVHISGGVPLGAGNGAFHGVDQDDFLHKMFTDVTKWSVRVERAQDIPDILSRAFALSVSGRPGPVHVDIPQDIAWIEEAEIPRYQPAAVKKQTPSEELLRQVRQTLAEARRPVICAGRGVLVHHAEAELIALAEATSAPVLYSTHGNGAIADEHPLAAGDIRQFRENPFAWELLAQSDFLLVVGMRSNTVIANTLLQHAPEHTVFVALDEPHTLCPMEGATTVALSDCRLFLTSLLNHADELKRPLDPALQARIARHKQALQKGIALHMAPYENAQPLHFGRVAQELAAQLDQDAIVITCTGNHSFWGQMVFPPRDRESFIEEGSWGTMGSELAGGIAAKLIYPQRQVVVVTGDGALLMSASDFVTAVETGANILVLVLNDSRYGMITALQQRQFQRSFGDQIGQIDFAHFAQSFGAAGVRVESPETLPDAVARSLALSAQKPVILDAVCSHQYGWPDQEAILALGLKQEA